jgi:hypothetical protein
VFPCRTGCRMIQHVSRLTHPLHTRRSIQFTYLLCLVISRLKKPKKCQERCRRYLVVRTAYFLPRTYSSAAHLSSKYFSLHYRTAIWCEVGQPSNGTFVRFECRVRGRVCASLSAMTQGPQHQCFEKQESSRNAWLDSQNKQANRQEVCYAKE